MDAKGVTVKFYFCNKCRKRIMPPSFLNKTNIGGKIKLNCGDKKCTGSVTIKPKNQTKDEQVHSKTEQP